MKQSENRFILSILKLFNKSKEINTTASQTLSAPITQDNNFKWVSGVGEYVVQDSLKSIVVNGIYDFDNLSDEELNTILTVLRNTYSGKYTKDFLALGLSIETYHIVYKPRYILNEIIIQRYSCSKSPYDNLAVAFAYQTKGAMFYKETVQFYEKFLNSVSEKDKKLLQTKFILTSEPSLSNSISIAYEHIYDFENALKYAIEAEKYNTMNLPYYPKHIGSIYLKIDPSLAVKYYRKVILSAKYSDSRSAISKELENAETKLDKGYVYKPRPYKPKERDIIIQQSIQLQAKNFLPGGKYYSAIVAYLA